MGHSDGEHGEERTGYDFGLDIAGDVVVVYLYGVIVAVDLCECGETAEEKQSLVVYYFDAHQSQSGGSSDTGLFCSCQGALDAQLL